jgi:hypothetical protein
VIGSLIAAVSRDDAFALALACLSGRPLVPHCSGRGPHDCGLNKPPRVTLEVPDR